MASAPPASIAAEKRLTSEHFAIRYDADRLPTAAAESAREAAERAYVHCQRLFRREPSTPVDCDLTPDFYGATGFAVPRQTRPRMGVRLADLDYLGLNGPYVITHEVAHLFTGAAAGGPLGEGLADFVAGDLGDVPLAPWWGGVLRRRGLWVDPDALFVTGDYPGSAELDARLRIARYTEPALLVHFLVGEFGFDRVVRFLPAYEKVRRTLASNDERRGPRERALDPEAVRASFLSAFGATWDELRRRWEVALGAPAPSDALADRLVLSQQIYATIRNYETWWSRRRARPPDWGEKAVRQACVAANRALARGRPKEAQAHLDEARRLISGLRNPTLSAEAKSLQREAGTLSLTPGIS